MIFLKTSVWVGPHDTRRLWARRGLNVLSRRGSVARRSWRSEGPGPLPSHPPRLLVDQTAGSMQWAGARTKLEPKTLSLRPEEFPKGGSLLVDCVCHADITADYSSAAHVGQAELPSIHPPSIYRDGQRRWCQSKGLSGWAADRPPRLPLIKISRHRRRPDMDFSRHRGRGHLLGRPSRSGPPCARPKTWWRSSSGKPRWR